MALNNSGNLMNFENRVTEIKVNDGLESEKTEPK